MASTPKPISWCEEIRPDSVWSFEHLGFSPVDKHGSILILVLSRDGSRRIVRGVWGAVVNPLVAPQFIYDPPRPDDRYQGWEGIKLYALSHKDDPGQTVLMFPYPRGSGVVRPPEISNMYLPYNPVGQTRPVPDPVNPIPSTYAIRDEISVIAAGWDNAWHSRYIFANHLRQQVASRLVDGLLADIERDIQVLLAEATPIVNTDWKAKLPPIEAAAKAICAACIGDPYVWARSLARNIDLEAFRLRLAKGKIPALNMASKPWQPGATVASVTFPVNTDVNAQLELAARWHDTNRTVVEDHLLPWYDEVALDPEKEHVSTTDHFHPDS